MGLSSVLPAAFYDLYIWYPPLTTQGHVQDHLLSAEDLRCFIHGKASLDAAFAEIISVGIQSWASPAACSNRGAAVTPVMSIMGTKQPTAKPASCKDMVQKRGRSLASSALRTTLPPPRDLFHMIDSRTNELEDWTGNVCHVCRDAFASSISERCTSLWNRIPKLFRLDTPSADTGGTH